VSPHGNYWIYCHTHGRFERVELLTVAIVNLGQDVHGGGFPLRREEDVGFVRVTEFKTEINVARCWMCSRSASACPGSSSTPELSEKLVTDNVVSRLKSNRTQGRVGPGDPRGGGGTPPSGIPPGVYYADLTLGGQPITVKLLVREHKRDSGTQARYLYTTDLSLSEEEIEEAWRMRWEIEELHRDVRAWDWRTPHSGGGIGFRATSRSSPWPTSSGS